MFAIFFDRKLDSGDQTFMRYSLLSLRIGLGLVFLLFAFDKLTNPGGRIAEIMNIWYMEPIFGGSFEAAKAFAFVLGMFELIIGTGMILGLFTRTVALGGSVFLFLILVGYWGYADIVYRDVGLLGASLALLFAGPGDKSLDSMLSKKPV